MTAMPRNMRPPTDRQLELLGFMTAYHDAEGDWPTHRQIAAALGINSPNIGPYLRLLEAKGLLRTIPGRSRRNRAVTTLGRTVLTDREWTPTEMT